VTHITEVQGLEGDTVLLQDIFVFEQQGIDAQGRVIGRHRAAGFRPLGADRIRVAGFPLPEDLFISD
jgi:pilus assembly protein CpaF